MPKAEPGPSPDDRPRPDPEPGASWFAWGAWLAMTAAATWFVARFGPEVPIHDDYALMPALAGEQPVTPGYLWSQHNEHRVPLPRLVLLGAYRATGHDFRAGMFVTVGCLAALAAGLMAAIGRARGGASYADASFPILLLHWGHQDNLLWSWQVSFGLSTLLAVGAGGVIATRRGPVGPGTLAGLGVMLALLPLCAASGLVMVPPLAAWLIGLGIARLRKGEAGGRVAIGAALPGVLLTAAYLVGYERPPQSDRPSDAGAVVRTAWQFLAVGFGPAAGEAWRVVGPAMLGLAVATTAMLLGARRGSPGDRSRALGMLAVLAGCGLLALGVAWGRAGTNDRGGLEPRYVTLAAQIPCLAALAWARFGSRVSGRLVPMVVFASGLVMLWPNAAGGLERGTARKSATDAVLADLRAGLPPFAIAARHLGVIHTKHDDLTAGLAPLVRRGLGVFRGARPDPLFREVPVGPPAALSLARWDERSRTIEATGVDPWATFELPRRAFVAGIRIRYDLENGSASSARFKLGWRRSDQAGFPESQQYPQWTLPVGPGRTLVVWIAEPIDAFRIQPDNRPCTFRIEELVVLVPDGPGPS